MAEDMCMYGFQAHAYLIHTRRVEMALKWIYDRSSWRMIFPGGSMCDNEARAEQTSDHRRVGHDNNLSLLQRLRRVIKLSGKKMIPDVREGCISCLWRGFDVTRTFIYRSILFNVHEFMFSS